MRTIILIACCCFLASQSNARQTGKKYTFPEVGWTIILPEGFTKVDSADDAARNAKGKKILEDANDIEVDDSELKTLISAVKNQFNYFNSTISPFDVDNDGDYGEVTQGVKDMMYIAFAENIPGGKIDSATTKITIDGLQFDKFHVVIALNGKHLMDMCLLSKLYKGYDFGISYVYLDEQTKEQIETMLEKSTFVK